MPLAADIPAPVKISTFFLSLSISATFLVYTWFGSKPGYATVRRVVFYIDFTALSIESLKTFCSLSYKLSILPIVVFVCARVA